MSFKDLEERKTPARVETPEDAELRAKSAARHRAKEERRSHERREGTEAPGSGGSGRGEPPT